MRLHELDEVTDEVVLFENVLTHKNWKNPLFYERSKKRYAQFAKKIRHFIDDDGNDEQAGHYFRKKLVNNDKLDAGFGWKNEYVMRVEPWLKYKALYGHNITKYADTLFIHSDLDEIPSAEAIAHLNYCEPTFQLPVRLNGVMFNQNFEHTSGLTDGHIWVLTGEDIEHYNNGKLPRGPTLINKKSHDLSNWFPGYVPNRCHDIYTDIFKELALAEGGMIPRDPIQKNIFIRDPERAYEMFINNGIRICCPRTSYSEKIPWFANHNRHRFPNLFPAFCRSNSTACL